MQTIVRIGSTQSYKGIKIPTIQSATKSAIIKKDSFMEGSPFGGFTQKKKTKKKS